MKHKKAESTQCDVSWCDREATVKRKPGIKLKKGLDSDRQLCDTHMGTWESGTFYRLDGKDMSEAKTTRASGKAQPKSKSEAKRKATRSPKKSEPKRKPKRAS